MTTYFIFRFPLPIFSFFLSKKARVVLQQNEGDIIVIDVINLNFLLRILSCHDEIVFIFRMID